MPGPLDGLIVLDLSRVMAGPTCTQLLGDMGAEVWKIENPSTGGDDTRTWGPPWMPDANGERSDLSAYFMSANRNKKSVALDGKEVLRRKLKSQKINLNEDTINKMVIFFKLKLLP